MLGLNMKGIGNVYSVDQLTWHNDAIPLKSGSKLEAIKVEDPLR